ncbi:hypothetical protein FRC04_002651 [Tulasnella sp. 424]|nr:hypothetical protein FRC04_002651 [Tulasnella sp. 424]KAG8974161.1 hypothetical protein FRC05_007737 [Tulasnella sp. 425]
MNSLQELKKRIKPLETQLKAIQVQATHYYDRMQEEAHIASSLDSQIVEINARLDAFEEAQDQIQKRIQFHIENKNDEGELAEKTKLMRLTVDFRALMDQKMATRERKRAAERESRRLVWEREKSDRMYSQLLGDLNMLRGRYVQMGGTLD